MRWTTVLLTLVIAAMGGVVANADVPHTLNYQGFVAEIEGAPLGGNHVMEFKLYESEECQDWIWDEIHPSVAVNHGVFSVVLGKSDSLNLPFDVQTYWLGVSIDGLELHPRKEFAAVLYALRSDESEYALVAAVAESLVGDGDTDWVIAGGNIHRNEGNVGIHTTEPSHPLDVSGRVRCDELSVSDDVWVDDHIYIHPFPGPVPPAGWALYVAGDTRLSGSLSFAFDYDSLWYSIEPGFTVVLSHSLWGDASEYVVVLEGRSSDGGIHQSNFGTSSYRSAATNKWLGCEWWGMTNALIRVTRAADDDEAGPDRDWNEFRVRIIKNSSLPGSRSGGEAHEVSAPRR